MFGRDSQPTIVYRYDIRSNMKPRLSPLDVVRDQLGKARHYRNLLIEAELAGRQAFRQLRSEKYPDYNALEEAYAEADATVEGLAKQIKAEKAKAYLDGKKPDLKALIAAKAEAVANRKRIGEQLKGLRAEVNADSELKEAGDNARFPLEEAADAWANANGLYQATKRKVAEAVFQATKSAKTDPVFSKWDGSGRLSCQIQAQKIVLDRKGPCTWQAACLGRYDTLIKVRQEYVQVPTGIAGHFAQKEWTIVSVRLGSDDKGKPIFVDCPIILHRTPPPDAVIKWVEVVCKREGREFKYYLCLQMARKDGWAKPDLAPGWPSGG